MTASNDTLDRAKSGSSTRRSSAHIAQPVISLISEIVQGLIANPNMKVRDLSSDLNQYQAPVHAAFNGSSTVTPAAIFRELERQSFFDVRRVEDEKVWNATSAAAIWTVLAQNPDMDIDGLKNSPDLLSYSAPDIELGILYLSREGLLAFGTGSETPFLLTKSPLQELASDRQGMSSGA